MWRGWRKWASTFRSNEPHDPEHRHQIEELYQAARDREKRASVLAAADPELRREVEALLAQEIESTVTHFAAEAQLGPYKIEAPIGAGAMGEVFRAHDTRLHRTVAIKVLPHERVADPDRKRRFLQEARAASALNHPNIIMICDISSEAGTGFLVMEYVRAKNLKELITPSTAGALRLTRRTPAHWLFASRKLPK